MCHENKLFQIKHSNQNDSVLSDAVRPYCSGLCGKCVRRSTSSSSTITRSDDGDYDQLSDSGGSIISQENTGVS